MSPITTLVDFTEFQSGWWIGCALLPVVGFAGWIVVSTGSTRRGPSGLMGPAWVVASLLSLSGWARYEPVTELPDQLLWSLLLLAGANELAARTPNPKVIGCVLCALPGYLLATSTDFAGPGWIVPLVTVTVTVGGPLGADLDRRAARLGLGPLMWLVTVIGVYATVPDTELVRGLVGAAIPLAILGWPLRVARLGAGGVAAGVGLLMWVAAIEGYGRPGSIVGAAGALGLFLVEPIGRVVVRRRVVSWSRSLSVAAFVAVFIAVHVLVVAYATRIAGFETNGGPAAALLVPGLVAGAAFGGLLGLSRRVRPGRPWYRRRAPQGANHPVRAQPKRD